MVYQQYNETPLHFAVDMYDEARGLAVATLLLDRGADIEAPGRVWYTLLYNMLEVIGHAIQT